MSKFAADTNVSAEKSRAEIERTLHRYGADQFMYGWEQENAVVGFRILNRMVRFALKMPTKDEYSHTPTGRKRDEKATYSAWEQACRQRWRALNLVIKAKLESVDCGIMTFEEEFMANIVLPDGKTVSEFMLPQIAVAYEQGEMPKMLPYLR